MFKSVTHVKVGDIFVKKSSVTLPEHWRKWTVDRIVVNSDGTQHAILAFPSGSRNTRRIALSALTEEHGWRALTDSPVSTG